MFGIKRTLESILSEKGFQRLYNSTFRDVTGYFSGMGGGLDLSVHHYLMDRNLKNPVLKEIAETGFWLYKKFADVNAYEFAVEGAALNVFSLGLGMLIEQDSGFDYWTMIKTRAIAMATNLMFGRACGWARTRLYEKTNSDENSHWAKKGALDSIAFFATQLPLYLLNMRLAKATVPNMKAASIRAGILSFFIGRPYGVFLDGMRVDAGLPIDYSKYEQQKRRIAA
jgi:hypothetical protein